MSVDPLRCPVCGQLFVIRSDDGRAQRRRYCSDRCDWADRQRKRRAASLVPLMLRGES